MTRNQAFLLKRRQLLTGISTGVACYLLMPAASRAKGSVAAFPLHASPLDLKDVRLKPSFYLDAVNANLQYLLELSPDRFLHNYYKFAGLETKGRIYGGWESDTIAGEGLGHYLSALALMYAQTGNEECLSRANYIVDQLDIIQKKHGDGYIAGFMRRRKDGEIVDGKEIFPEIMAGDIRSAGFDLNGCWVPFYNWHKVFAGLLDVQYYCGNDKTIHIMEGLGGYIENVFNHLNDEQLQKVLACEHGGINESFAELYVRTKNPRWLKLAERIHHNAVLLPLENQQDRLANIHANTQIPKVIGLARLYEITNDKKYETASRFFWDRVVHHHSFVIGGNADREYFFEPDHQHEHITEQTCESCNTYNMLKLTRHLFSWSPDGKYFDYYERAHLNHIMAHQNPKTSRFTYMMPLMSGTSREYSTAEDSFWCCVLTGIESHSKHGDSIYFEGENTLFINLFIPSDAYWPSKKTRVGINTNYPYDGNIDITISPLHKTKFTVAIRKPSWLQHPLQLKVNGKSVLASEENNYILINRKWAKGDKISLEFPMNLQLEQSGTDNKKLVVLKQGPLVLAADLGESDKDNKPFTGRIPALVSDNILTGIIPIEPSKAIYKTSGISKPYDIEFKPFYSMYERRTAVYLNAYTPSEWDMAQIAIASEEARQRDLAARSVDIMYLGEMQPERDHKLLSDISYPVVYRGKNGRDARTLGFFSFEMNIAKAAAKPMVLQATYWGGEFNRSFDIIIDGKIIASEKLSNSKPGEWLEVEYKIPPELTKNKQKITIRFQPTEGKTAGPVFGVRLFTVK